MIFEVLTNQDLGNNSFSGYRSYQQHPMSRKCFSTLFGNGHCVIFVEMCMFSGLFLDSKHLVTQTLYIHTR